MLKITTTAIKQFKTIRRLDNTIMGFRLSLKSGGCNGFNYKLVPLNNEYNNLDTFSFVSEKDAKVYIEPMSELYLIGTTIDYINEDYSKGIYESKFKFIPDKDKASTCGCGVSFSPKF